MEGCKQRNELRPVDGRGTPCGGACPPCHAGAGQTPYPPRLPQLDPCRHCWPPPMGLPPKDHSGLLMIGRDEEPTSLFFNWLLVLFCVVF